MKLDLRVSKEEKLCFEDMLTSARQAENYISIYQIVLLA